MKSKPHYVVMVNSPSPDEIASSRIADDLVRRVSALLIDREDGRYRAYYLRDGGSIGTLHIGADDSGLTARYVPSHPQTVGAACIDILDDNPASREQRADFYNAILPYIAERVGGFYLPKTQKIRLKRLTQEQIADVLLLTDCPLIAKSYFTSIWYSSVPESVAFETGFPSEKVKLHRLRE